YRLAPDAEVAIDGGRRGVPRPGQLADLAPGAVVSLTLSADQKAVESVLAEGPVVRGRVTAVDPKAGTLTVALLAERREAGAEGASVPGLLKAVDPEKGTVTVVVRRGRGEEPEEKTWPLAKGARVVVEGKDGSLADLKAGDEAFAVVRLSLDQKAVTAIQAGR